MNLDKESMLASSIARGVMVVLMIVAGGVGLCCWKAGDGIPSRTDVAAFAREQVACSSPEAGARTREEVDACRAESRAKWCARYPAAQDCTDGREGGLPYGD